MGQTKGRVLDPPLRLIFVVFVEVVLEVFVVLELVVVLDSASYPLFACLGLGTNRRSPGSASMLQIVGEGGGGWSGRTG